MAAITLRVTLGCFVVLPGYLRDHVLIQDGFRFFFVAMKAMNRRMAEEQYSYSPQPLAVSVTFDADSFTVHLNNGRALSVPYVYSPGLAGVTLEQRADYRIIGSGDGIHWPQLDEDLSVAGLLRGTQG